MAHEWHCGWFKMAGDAVEYLDRGQIKKGLRFQSRVWHYPLSNDVMVNFVSLFLWRTLINTNGKPPKGYSQGIMWLSLHFKE